jgi:hypothetical protein
LGTGGWQNQFFINFPSGEQGKLMFEKRQLGDWRQFVFRESVLIDTSVSTPSSQTHSVREMKEARVKSEVTIEYCTV